MLLHTSVMKCFVLKPDSIHISLTALYYTLISSAGLAYMAEVAHATGPAL